jgi:spore coat protein H
MLSGRRLTTSTSVRTHALFLVYACLAYQAAGAETSAKPARDEGVFDPAPVHTYRLEIPEEGLAKLGAEPKTYVKGAFREDDTLFPEVAIRLKGNAGSFRPLGEKPAFTVKFDEYVPKQRYRGLQKVSLNNAVQDPTYLSDLIGNELFRAAGIPAPRIGHARVFLNGADQGFYTVLEAITRDFLARSFADPSGNLYKGPGDVDSDDIYVDPRSAARDRNDLKTLAAAAAEPDFDARWERMGAILDLDRFASFLALETINWHWDGYSMALNNFDAYFDPSSNRLVFFPHDQDQLFGEPRGSMYPQVSGLVAKAFRGMPRGRALYRERVVALTEKLFDPAAIAARLETMYRKINPAIAAMDPEQGKAHREALDDMLRRIHERAQSLKEQFLGPEPAPPRALAFEDGKARPSGWESRTAIGEPAFARASRDGREGAPALRIAAPEKGECCGSFRTNVILPAGRYRFTGMVKTDGVVALGTNDEETPSGAGLRVSGKQPPRKLLGDRDWTQFEFEFTVEAMEQSENGTPLGRAELVCELRASAGSAWFDEGSLALLSIPEETSGERE